MNFLRLAMKYTLPLVFLASLISVVQAETVTYYVNDALGSPVAAMDQSGQVLWRESYNPYGDTRKNPSQNQNDVGFTGHQKDDATGLTYMQARYYDPVVGRFYGNDPVDYTDANPVMSFNRYSYANNNPYKYTDPDGELVFLLFNPVTLAAAEYVVVAGTGLLIGAFIAEAIDESSDSGQQGGDSDNDGGGEDWESDYEGWASGNSDNTTGHGKGRESRGVDKDKTRERGERFRDTESGGTVYVDGENVVIDGEEGNITSWGDQTEEETEGKVEDGVWEPIE